MSELTQYRQPMVTSTGIFLGFMLNVAISWITNPAKDIFRDSVIAICIVSTLTLLVIVLYRMLKMAPQEDGNTYYRKTLYMFITGICIPFFAMIIIIVEKLLVAAKP